jgi:hypothetical protein
LGAKVDNTALFSKTIPFKCKEIMEIPQINDCRLTINDFRFKPEDGISNKKTRNKEVKDHPNRNLIANV